MKRACWLLTTTLLWAVPSPAAAQSHPPPGPQRSSSTCLIRHRDVDVAPPIPLRCTAGVAISVGWSAMKVRPTRGATLRVRFTDDTEFETDSGEGVLDGLAAGDYVCVAYKPRSGIVTALLVLFSPDSLPCAPRRALSAGAWSSRDTPSP